MSSFMGEYGITVCAAKTDRIAIICLQPGHNIFIDISRIDHRYDLQCFRISNAAAIDQLLLDAHFLCQPCSEFTTSMHQQCTSPERIARKIGKQVRKFFQERSQFFFIVDYIATDLDHIQRCFMSTFLDRRAMQ
jgi:hypothetical protein